MSPLTLKLLNDVLRKLPSQRNSPVKNTYHYWIIPVSFTATTICLIKKNIYRWLKKKVHSCKAVSCKDIQVNRHVLKSLSICKSNMYIFLIHTHAKHQNFPGQSPIIFINTYRKGPPLTHKHPQPLFRQTFYSSQLILTSSKWSLEAWCGLFVHWMFYAAQSIRWTFITLKRTSAWEATTNAVKPTVAFLLEAKYPYCPLWLTYTQISVECGRGILPNVEWRSGLVIGVRKLSELTSG